MGLVLQLIGSFVDEVIVFAHDHQEVVQGAVGIGVGGQAAAFAGDLLEDGLQHFQVKGAVGAAFAELDGIAHARFHHGHVDGGGPGGEPAGHTLLIQLLLDGAQHEGNVAFMAGHIDAQGCGIAVIGAGAALLGIDGALLQNGDDQRLLHGAVGGEEGGILAILGHLPGHILQDELLGAGNAGVAGGIGSGHVHIFNAQGLACGDHLLAPGGDGGIGQVAGKGIVDEGLGAHHVGQRGDGVAHGQLIRQEADVRLGGHNRRVFRHNAADEQHVGAGLPFPPSASSVEYTTAGSEILMSLIPFDVSIS